MGGYLGSQLHDVISNNKLVRANKKLKELMIDELMQGANFESAYSKAITQSEFDSNDRNQLKSAIISAYQEMCRNVMHFRKGEHPNHFNFKGMIAQVATFFNPSNEKCFIFTVNQDPFFEYWFNWRAPAAPWTGEGKDPDQMGFQNLSSSVTFGEVTKAIQSHAGPSYLKLHGSYGWLSSTGEPALVIGALKQDQIQREPLLKHYFEWFREVLERNTDRRILIIGYGFGDIHINEVLKNSIAAGAKIFIINPRDRKSFIQNLNEKGLSKIAAAVECYYPWHLKEVFYSGKSDKWKNITEDMLTS